MAVISVKVDLNLSKEGFEKGAITETTTLAFKGDMGDLEVLVYKIKQFIGELEKDRKQ